MTLPWDGALDSSAEESGKAGEVGGVWTRKKWGGGGFPATAGAWNIPLALRKDGATHRPREDQESVAPCWEGCYVLLGGPLTRCLAQVGNLKAHLKIHIADGPLKCRECGKQFTTSGRARPAWLPHAPPLLSHIVAPHARPSLGLLREP